MKYLKYLALISALAFSPLCALARGKNEHSVDINDAVKVGKTQLKPGNYKVEWQGTGPAVQVTFQHYGKVVATMPATLQTSDKSVTVDAIVTHKIDATTHALDEIDFAHQKEALIFASQGGM